MKVHRNHLVVAAALALVAICAASTAKAQLWSVYRGTLTLPFEAKWENTVLPAGDYTLRVNRVAYSTDSMYRVTFSREGKEESRSFVKAEGPTVHGSDLLIATQSAGNHRIQILQLGTTNLVFRFSDPTKAGQELTAGGSKLIRIVPITVAGKSETGNGNDGE